MNSGVSLNLGEGGVVALINVGIIFQGVANEDWRLSRALGCEPGRLVSAGRVG